MPTSISAAPPAPQTECPSCGHLMSAVKPWLEKCSSCGFLLSSLPAGAGTGVAGLKTLRVRNFEIILERIRRQTDIAGKLLLEVGCARGWFLEAAARCGAQVRGLEPEAENAQIARAAGLSVDVGFFPDGLTENSRFDIIVFNDVFEHLPDPVAAIVAVEQHLNPGGLAVINLPSADGVIYQLATNLDRIGIAGPFDRLWQRGMASPHISYFAPATLEALVSKHTAMVQVHAGRLDVLTRQGLWSRIRSTYSGPASAWVFPVAWAGSFALSFFPSDIAVLFYQKPD